MSDAARDPAANRALVTVCLMAATYMQGSLSATQDQVSWVLTSYIVAAAIMTAPVGWLALRYGSKRLLIVCSTGFTLASMLCGLAQSIDQMVLYRLLQGVFGAALVPLSRSVMMDIYPVERRGQAMAIWGMGVMIGPIMGPTLGGWLTDQYSWRWVFFVNLPFGIATVLGLLAFMTETRTREGMTFDWLGFATLSIGIGSFQLMLDRGESLSWFDSREVCIEAMVAAAGVYLFIAQMVTADKPFVPVGIFLDRNFVIGLVFMFVIGIILLASLALITPYVQGVMGYPVLTSGVLLGTRGVGTMGSMMVVGRLMRSIDSRILIFFGLTFSTLSLYWSAQLSPETSAASIAVTSIVQGVGLGLVFIPLNTVAFSTLSPALRTEATAMWTLIRNIGSAAGVSVVVATLTSGTSLMHARLGEALTPWNLGLASPEAAGLDVTSPTGAAMLEGIVTTQSVLIAYANDFTLMTWVSLAAFPLLLLLRKPSGRVAGGGTAAAHLD